MTPPGVRSFSARLRAGEHLLGALVRMPNEGLVELAGMVGLDFVVLDTEHGPGDQLALAHHLNAAVANGLSTIVRIGAPAEALRVLDLGADGVLAPHVSSVAQARDLVDAVHYPPLGRRGFAGYTRAGRYGLTPAREHHARGRDAILIAMIEDPDGLAVAADIALVDGVDGLMLGPADFAVELGTLGREDPRVAAAAAAVLASAHAAGGAAVAIVGSEQAARRQFEAGTSVVMYNVQLALGQLFTGLAGARPSPANASSGRRQSLLLLPGMLGTADAWDGVAENLLDVAVAQVGRIDLDDSIAEMAATVLASAPARFALAGHSLGAIVAMEIMRQAPERVTRLALLNTGAHAPFEQQQSGWAALLDRIDDQFDAVAVELATDTLPADRRRELLPRNLAMARQVGAGALRRQLVAQQGRTSYLDDVGRYRVPVLIVSGGRDEICPPDRQEALFERCPQAEMVTVDAGHMAPLERPGAVADALRAWLAR